MSETNEPNEKERKDWTPPTLMELELDETAFNDGVGADGGGIGDNAS